MRNVLLMTVLDGFEQNDTNIASLLLVVVGLLDDAIEQLSSVHFLCNQIVVLLLFEDIKQANDVWVVQFLQYSNLIFERDFILLREFGLSNNLYSIRFSSFLARAFAYHTESTGSKLLIKLVNSEKGKRTENKISEQLTTGDGTHLLPKFVRIGKLLSRVGTGKARALLVVVGGSSPA